MSKPKGIIATHQDGKEVKYHSIANAAKVFKCKEDHIRRALRGERNTACGMKWRYV